MKDDKNCFNKFWGDNRLRARVEFIRGSDMKCVYCGEQADTREHCPSRTFLAPPRPTNLPIVPACSKCNNSYSSDEKYTSTVIKIFYAYFMEGKKEVLIIQPTDSKEMRVVKTNLYNTIKNGIIKFDDKMARIFVKLAICHATYELTEGYYSDDWNGKPDSVSYTFRSFLSKQDWDDLEYAEVFNKNPLPEVGSRIFRNIYVIETPSKNNQKEISSRFLVLDWTNVQDKSYKYIAFIKDQRLYVRIIIKEFIFIEVIFKQSC